MIQAEFDPDRINEILTTRAAVLAQVPGVDQGQTVKQYVTFKLGGERYGLDVSLVEEIQPLKDLTLIPCTPDFVVGAVNIRAGCFSLTRGTWCSAIANIDSADFK